MMINSLIYINKIHIDINCLLCKVQPILMELAESIRDLWILQELKRNRQQILMKFLKLSYHSITKEEMRRKLEK